MSWRGRRAGRGCFAVTALALGLAACGGSSGGSAPDITAAPDATSAGCISLGTQLPSTLLGRRQGTTTATGAALWGDPAIVLRCGVTPPGPSADACIEVNDVDWLFTENTTAYLFITYGREPAAELTIPKAGVDRTAASGALAELTHAVEVLPVGQRCNSVDS